MMGFRVVFVVYVMGLMGDLVGQTRVHHLRPPTGGRFGSSVAAIGDVDADGSPDFAVGAPFHYNATLLAQTGSVSIHSGVDGSRISILEGSMAHESFGLCVAQAGDLDGDSIVDLAIGSRDRVHVRSSASGVILFDVTGPSLGETIAKAGDIDGDGVEDLLLGAPLLSVGPKTRCGGVALLSGATGALLGWWEGSAPFQYLGRSVAATADALLLSSPQLTTSQPGFVMVIEKLGLGQRLILSEGHVGASFGWSCCGLGDLDGDGVDEIAVGAPWESIVVPNTEVGSIRIFSGASGLLIRHLTGVGVSDRLGGSVRLLGDLDGDGVCDLLTGTYPSAAFPPGGDTRVYSGANGALLVDIPVDGLAPVSSLDALGDLNQDGVPDWVVGVAESRTIVPGGFVRGAVSVFSGASLSAPSVSYLAGSCGSGSPSLTLDALPVVGTTVTLSTAGFPAGSSGHLYFTPGSSFSTPLGGMCVLTLDPSPSVPWTAVPITHDSSGAWSVVAPIPTSLYWAGSVMTLQAATSDPLAPLGIALTNGLELSFGY